MRCLGCLSGCVGWMLEGLDGLDGENRSGRLDRRSGMWIGIPSFESQ